MRSPVAVIVALALAVLSAGPARAQAGQPVLDRAAAALRSEPVYVDGAAELGQDVDADRLVQRIRQREARVYIAILPGSAAGEAGGDASAVPPALARKVGLAGTYGVVTGRSFRAGSTNLPTGRAAALASASFQAHREEGLQAVLLDFVDRVDTTAGGSSKDQGAPFEGGSDGAGDSGGDGGSSVLPLLLLAGAGGGGFYLWQKGKRRREEEALQDEADWSLLRAEVSVLAEDVMALEPEVALHPEAQDDYEAAVARYRVAQAAVEQGDRRIDHVRVQRVVTEGQYAMSRAKAIIDGREPPPPPEDLSRPGRRDEPALDMDEDGRPAYVGYGSPFYGGGWFGGGGGLLTGLFLGQMLGGGWGGGYHEQNINVEGDNQSEGSGDFGGGDWGGGGDFGGGDFGGGDFGGGGGDF